MSQNYNILLLFWQITNAKPESSHCQPAEKSHILHGCFFPPRILKHAKKFTFTSIALIFMQVECYRK